MQITFTLDEQDAKTFFPYLTQVRNRAAKELTTKQREVDIAEMTSVVATLGKLSRAIAIARELEQHRLLMKQVQHAVNYRAPLAKIADAVRGDSEDPQDVIARRSA